MYKTDGRESILMHHSVGQKSITETAEAQTVTVGKIMQGKRLQISLEGHLLNQLHQIKYSFRKFHSDFCQDSVWTPLGIFSIKGCRGKYTS